jgi:TolA-binding protein
MSYKPVIIALLSVTLLSAVQQTPNSTSQAAGSQAAAANAAENAQIRQLGNNRGNDAQAQRDDIRKMRALVAQMQTNLAFVDTTQSPLKHQFQLDIDMWNVVIAQMERRSYPNSR